MSLGWLWSLLARVAAALWDRWQSIQQAMARGAAEERARALRAAEEAERRGREAAEDAAKRPVDEDDGFRRD